MNPENAPVSLFVVHWNQPAECLATMEALGAQNIPLDPIVIDNDSKPHAREILETRLGPEVELVRLDKNRGWGGALNIALKNWLERRPNRFCIISAHDAVPAPECLRLLIEAAEADPRVGIACPQYHDPLIARFSPLRGVVPERVRALPRGVAQPVDAAHGTLMLCRRECLQQIGLFDERYFAYGDEHELGMRARRNGWKVVMIWGAIVTNPGTATESPLRSYLFARNSLLLVRDYAGWWSALLRAMMILLNTLRLMLQSPGRNFAFSARARFWAVRDYFAGRWGKPGFAE
ncbi:MAG: glycosyltransferase family 2 protein [Verrucomicrobiota bacterium]|nr:glycosyltransferase family 2 protein [Verrucomicrobiota bacterium]